MIAYSTKSSSTSEQTAGWNYDMLLNWADEKFSHRLDRVRVYETIDVFRVVTVFTTDSGVIGKRFSNSLKPDLHPQRHGVIRHDHCADSLSSAHSAQTSMQCPQAGTISLCNHYKTRKFYSASLAVSPVTKALYWPAG